MEKKIVKYKAVIFDLDGVIVSTDNCHYLAWKKMADNEDIYFDREINERLRGVSRMESLEIILEKSSKEYSNAEKEELATYKNNIYKELILSLSPLDILDGVKDFINYLKSNSLKIAIGSSSKNTEIILKQIGLDKTFDAVVDGNKIKNSKPDPEVFVLAASELGLKNSDCLVVEDAIAGVDAGLGAQSDVLAVGFASSYKKATHSLESLKGWKKLSFI